MDDKMRVEIYNNLFKKILVKRTEPKELLLIKKNFIFKLIYK